MRGVTAEKPRPSRLALVLAAVATAIVLALLLVSRCWDEPQPADECSKPGQACGGAPAPAQGDASSGAAGGAAGGAGGGAPDSST